MRSIGARTIVGFVLCSALADAGEAQRHMGTSLPIEVAPAVREALALEGDIDSGRRIYASCAVCHGDDGRGRPDGTFPQLAGQHRSVLIKQLVDIRDGRRSNPIMAPYAEALIDSQEIADVTAYIATLPSPEPVPVEAPDDDPGGRLFDRDCAECHGADAQGDAARFVPKLAGQHTAYLLRQVRAIAAGRRANAHPDMTRRLSHYTDAELQSVIAHVTRLAGVSEDPTE
jgi:cytochrome c553